MQENKIQTAIETLASLGQIKALEALRDSLKSDYEAACIAIDSLSGQSSSYGASILKPNASSINTSGYKKTWNYADKFQFILNREKKFMRFREVAKTIIELDGKGEETHITRLLTSATKSLKDEGKIIKKVINGSLVNSFWGKSNWIDENNNIKPEYMYKPESIVTKSASTNRGFFDEME